jgi:outer membrane protein TolC
MKNLLCIILFFLVSKASAQEILSFNDCLDLSFKNNLLLKTAKISEELATYQYKASYGKLLPVVFADGDNRNTWGREVDPITNLYVDTEINLFRGGIEADYNIFSGFKDINGIKLANQEADIKKLNIDRIKFQITIELAKKYITILYLEEIINANKEQIKSSEKQLEIADLKFSNGTISESELFKIKSQKASEELDLLKNQNLLVDNLVNLKQLMNIPLEQEILLQKPNLDIIQSNELEISQYELAKKAVEINPNYSISLLEQDKAETSLSIARSFRYPELDMNFQYNTRFNTLDPINSVEDQFNTNVLTRLQFVLTIPIFNQFENSLRVKTGKININQSKVNTDVVKNELSKEVIKAITDTKTSIKKKETSAIAFEYSKKSYEADLLKFELGKININEMNTTKTNLNNAQADLIRSTYELLYNNGLIKFYLGEEFALK